MPLWVNENKDGLEYVCMCDRCGVEGPPSPSDDDAVEGFHSVREDDRDTIFLCPFCHVLTEEGPIPEEVTVSRVIALLQHQGSDLLFVPGTQARRLVDQLVQGIAREQIFTTHNDVSVRSTPDQVQQAIYEHIAVSFTRYPIDGFTRIKPPPGPCVELPPWAEPGALVGRGGTRFRIKEITASEVVLNSGSQLVVWSRSQRPFEEEFQPAPEWTRADLILEEE